MSIKLFLLLCFFCQIGFAEITRAERRVSQEYADSRRVLSIIPLARYNVTVDRTPINQLESCNVISRSDTPADLWISIEKKGGLRYGAWGTDVKLPDNLKSSVERRIVSSDGTIDFHMRYFSNVLTTETLGYGNDISGRLVYKITTKIVRFSNTEPISVNEFSYVETHDGRVVADILCANPTS